ncbi:CAP domain-containing protein [Uliginosibacterium sp. H3]|uniref:CAP domain-containing protein n=1 Tax=Uliginosibacterium silvisoli TaxID=3114758 RepID=A0ABU6KBB7_9RHOO|nr:CAP domain-containing protein [Uliginosibacterium sp. H3]
MLTSTLLAIIVMTLSGCGGGGGGGSGSSTGNTNTQPGVSSSSSISSASSSTSSTTSTSSSSAASAVSLYDTDPVIGSCMTGQLKSSERTVVLNKVNDLRARHGLLPVSYDASQDNAAAEAALYMVANATLTTTPSVSGQCYTTGAANLASTSSIFIAAGTTPTTQNFASTAPIAEYLMNVGVTTLASRRRLLNPFLGSTSFGRVDGQPTGSSFHYVSTVLKTQGNDVSDISAMSNDFVAYPYGIYPVAEFNTGWYLSFSAIASKINAAANGAGQVSFASAVITVMDGSTPLAVTDQAADYSAYGLLNALQWKVSGLQNNTTYSVQISNVVVNGVTRQYNYTFRLQ